MFARAEKVLPGGVTRGATFPAPYPPFAARAEGPYLYDLDGRPIVDFSNANFSLPMGHAHPAVIGAVRAQLANGLAFQLTSAHEVRLAELLCARVAALEQLRYTASGSEATMFALRLARAWTGRPHFAMMVGGYHGHTDAFQVSGVEAEKRVPAGVLPWNRDGVLLLPFNDPETCVRAIEARADALAAVFVEPLLGTGGMIPATPAFLGALRDVTRRHDILLVFDEMISLGVDYGGAQGYYGVTPDLTTIGKVIGGGMPIGAFGGRADLMALVDPRGPATVFQSGTFVGHPLSMVAGVAHLEALTPEVYLRLETIGDDFRARLRDVIARRGAPIQITGLRQFFGLHFTAAPVRDGAAAARTDREVAARVMRALLHRGYFVTGLGRGALSTALQPEHLEGFPVAFAEALAEVGI
jgi:glutamate-1-semialdehyde 2,1-aminomutase